MKKMKALASMLAAAAVLTLLPGGGALKAEAAEAKNYAVKFCSDEGDNGEWRYQEGSSFSDESSGREIYYLLQVLKDDDKVAVYNSESGAEELNLGSAKLGNLTLCNTSMTVVYTGGISQCYILPNSTCSINGSIDAAYVYDVSAVTFVNNVTDLFVSTDTDDFYSNISCGGTVGHFKANSTSVSKTFYDLYNFSQGTFAVSDGVLKTGSWAYTASAPAATETPQATAAPQSQATAAPAASAAAAAQTGSGEYDDVPKTGEGSLVFLLLAASAVCFTGSCILRKKAE